MKISETVLPLATELEREIDFYVPITYRVRSYISNDVGPRRIVKVWPDGEMVTEFWVPADTGEITRMVILFMPATVESLCTEGSSVIEGSPCFELGDAAFEQQGDFMVATLDIPTSLGFGEDSMDLIFGRPGRVEKIIRSGATDFLLQSGRLAGVRFRDLSPDEIALMRECQLRDEMIRRGSL